jgi:hypothetical protein
MGKKTLKILTTDYTDGTDRSWILNSILIRVIRVIRG